VGEMADRMQAAIEAEGGLEGDAAVPGTGTEDAPTTPAAAENTDTSRGGPPETIPYSRFAEVNSRLQELKDYETLRDYGIEPDSAVRLANFEAAYVQDPKAIIGTLIDSQQDLSDPDKAAMKALLLRGVDPDAGAQGFDEEGNGEVAIPPEVAQRLAYVDELRAREAEAESQQRLDIVVRHWDGLDEQDGLDVPERTKLVWISAAAGRGGYETLEQLGEAARTSYLEDRDHSLGSAVQSRSTGTPRTVPGSAAAPSPPEEFDNFRDANKQIMADIRAGRLPGIEQES
jgi:hypothetical protein